MPNHKIDTALLNDLKIAISGVNFPEGQAILRRNMILLKGYLARTPSAVVHDLVPLEILCLASEIYDYHGKATAPVIAAVGEECNRELADLLTNHRKSNPAKIPLYKQQIIALLHYGYTFYRGNDYNGAQKRWIICEKALEKIADSSFPCFGTWSRLHYALGLLHRQEHGYVEAKRRFALSIDASWNNIEFEQGKGRNFADLAVAEFRVAKNLSLGLGWVFYTESALHIARPLIAAARILLSGKQHEHIIRSYVDIVYASVLMAEGTEAGSREAIEILLRSYSFFEGNGGTHAVHPAYAIQAANELAHGYLRLARLSEEKREENYAAAEKCAVSMRNRTKGKNPKWFANANLVLSRIYRDQSRLGEAMNAANEVIEVGRSSKSNFLMIDGLLSVGEIYFSAGRFADAAKAFKGAFDLGESNPKVAAVCHLHLCRTYVFSQNLKRAEEEFIAWQNYAGIENGFIQRLARVAELDIANKRKELQMDFTIAHDIKKVNGKKIEQEFYAFLCTRAMKEANQNRERAAELLGIAPVTFDTWMEKSGFRKPKTATLVSGTNGGGKG